MCCLILEANSIALQVTVIRIAIRTNMKGICVAIKTKLFFFRKSFPGALFSKYV